MNTTLPHTLNSKKIAFKHASIDMLPLVLATCPWGVLCGALAIEAGLSPYSAQALSLFVFAGAAQISFLGMYGGVGFSPTVLSTTFIISSRHLLYSAALQNDVRDMSIKWRMMLAFFLTDEMFALASSFKQKHGYFCRHYALASGMIFYFGWNVSTFAGITLGQFFSSLHNLGFEFAIAATFIAIVIPSIRDFPVLCAVVTVIASSILLHLTTGNDSLLIPTLLGMAVGYVCSKVQRENNGA